MPISKRNRRLLALVLIGGGWLYLLRLFGNPADSALFSMRALLASLPMASPSAPPSKNKPAPAAEDESAKRLSELRAKMENEKKALQAIMQKQGGVLEKLDALQQQMRRAQARLKDLERQRNMLAEESKKLVQRSAESKRKLDERAWHMAERLRTRYRFGRTGYLHVWFGAESLADFSRRQKYLQALFSVDRAQIQEYRGLLALWQEAQARVDAKQASISSLQTVALEQQTEMESEKASLTEMLRQVREEKEMHEAVLKELKANESRLSGLIANLDRQAANERAAEEKRKQAAAPPKENPAPPAETASVSPASPAETPPPAVAAAPAEIKPAEPAAESPQKEALAEAVEEPAAPDVDFASLRGSLCYPAHGPINSGFGRKVHPQFNTVTMQNGIEIGAPSGASVRAVAGGVVRFADWLRGYGNLVIIDHGDGYYTVYAHLADIRVGNGARVKKGTSIGSVGDTGSLDGPSLYFEIRHHQEAINPGAWLGGC